MARPSFADSRHHSHRKLYSTDASNDQDPSLPRFAPLVSISKRPGLAADAAAQQAFHEKQWVWVPDPIKGYVSSWLAKEDGQGNAECMGEDDKMRIVAKDDLSRQNPPKFDQVEDMAELTHLNEASVVHNLERRFKNDRIYTYSGPFLVAVNPYRNLDAYYSQSAVDQYMNRRREENPPHIFAVAQQSWAQMISERESQSILVTGESGAGKTENTKKVIQFLTAIAADASSILPSSGSAETIADQQQTPSLSRANSHSKEYFANTKRLGKLEHQILQANPILEAFGNAQTVRNNNSSRFGKFVRIEFTSDGAIAGAFIDWYLLEKSRVTSRSENERSFHVFYQLLRGAPEYLRRELLLQETEPQSYGYLSISSNKVESLDDIAEWAALQRALDVVGFSRKEQNDIFKIIAVILHLGNLQITGRDRAIIDNPAVLEKTAHLLNVPIKDLTSALLQPRTKAGREWVTSARSPSQVVDEVASVSKTLYEKTFGAIVDRINQALDRPTAKSTFIGVLDIAGFEIFEHNSFEQLCINYTNEKLQQFFNHHMFVLEQEEYEREEIGWQFENFGLDLQPTIDLIESQTQPVGILACLDEECIMPKASDETFTEKLKQAHSQRPNQAGNSKFSAKLHDKLKFTVQHYAGKVNYETQEWLVKNKDPLNDNLTSVLAASGDAFVAGLFVEFSESANANAAARRTVVKRGAFRTVGQRHKEQLTALMTQLQCTSPHFVRCIVPNPHKRPSQINTPLVLDQLRCNGVLEGIRIARLGYPNRLAFVEFRHRYEVLTPGILAKGYVDGRVACQKMLAALQLDPAQFKVGRSKAFFKAGVLADLEERRDELLYGIFSRMQAACRRFTARRSLLKVLNRAMAARTIQRNARIYLELRQWPWWGLYTKVRPLLAATRADDELRRKEAELSAAKEREARELQERERLAKLQQEAALKQKELQDTLQQEQAARQTADLQVARFIERERILQENLDGAESDIDRLLATNEEQTKAIESLQANYQTLAQSFKIATEHLERLESEAEKWESAQTKLNNVQLQHTTQVQTLEQQKRDILGQLESLRADYSQVKLEQDRNDKTWKADVANLNAKRVELQQANEALQNKHNNLLTEHATLQSQVGDLSQASQGYTDILQKKEDEVAQHAKNLALNQSQNSALTRENNELRQKLLLFEKERETKSAEHSQAVEQRSQLQSQLTALQSTLALKVSEDKQRQEASTRLDEQLQHLQRENADLVAKSNSAAAEGAQQIARLQSALDVAVKERDAAVGRDADQRSELVQSQQRADDLEQSLATIERRSSARESELQTLQARHIELDTVVAHLQRQKEADERQISALKTQSIQATNRLADAENQHRVVSEQLSKLRSTMDAQNTAATKAEEGQRKAQRDLVDAQQRLKRQERVSIDLQATVESLTRELETSRNLESKTTIEHVHTLQEAMKVQDRQLAEAQRKIEQAQSDFRNLDKVRARLQNELQDARYQTQQDTSHTRGDLQKAQRLEQTVSDLKGKLDLERRAREAADSTSAKAKADLRGMQSQYHGLVERAESAERAKIALEKELKALSQRPTSPTYTTFANVGTGPQVSAGRKQILDQLARNNSDLTDQMGARLDSLSNAGSGRINGRMPQRGTSVDLTSSTSSKAAQSAELQVMMIDKAIADRVRKGLEAQVTELRQIVSDASRQRISPTDMTSRLDKENAKLQDLLQQEAAARKDAESARLQGSEVLNAYHLKVKASLDDRFAGLEQSRAALQAVQRQLSSDNTNLSQQLDAVKSELKQTAQISAQNEFQLDRLRNEHRLALDELDALREHIHTLDDGAAHSTRYEQQLAALQQESDSYRDMLEAAKIREDKAVKAQTFASMALAEAEKVKSEAVEDRESAENRARMAEARCRELEAQTAEGSSSRHVLASLERDCARLQEDLEAERKQRVRSENDSDARVYALQKGYQAQLEQLNAEFTEKQDDLVRIRAERDQLRTAHDELQLRLDDETYSSSAWRHEKENLTDNWARAKKAFDEAVQRQADSQAKNVELVQENRDLRMRMEDFKAERDAVTSAKRALEERLREFSSQKSGSQQPYRGAVELERDDFRKELDATKTSLAMAQARQTSAEKLANDQQRNAAREREEAGKVALVNNDLHRQVKDLQVRLANHEARSVASSPRPLSARNADGRIAELTQELQEERRMRTTATEASQTKEFQLKDLSARFQDEVQRRKRLEQDRDSDQNQILALRKEVADTRNAESAAKSEASKAAREVQTAVRDAERKIDALRNENNSLMKRLELGRSSTIGSLRTAHSSAGPLTQATNRDYENATARRRPF